MNQNKARCSHNFVFSTFSPFVNFEDSRSYSMQACITRPIEYSTCLANAGNRRMLLRDIDVIAFGLRKSQML